MEQRESFGSWLRRKRKALDLTQEGLGNLVGCSAAAIRKFEAEERRPSIQIVTRFYEIFDISAEDWEPFLRFARGDWMISITEQVTELPWHPLAAATDINLPSLVNPIIGREIEIVDIRSYLLNEAIREVTLIGPPGIGKTRLSLEVAHLLASDFQDGVFYVSLAPLDEPALIPSTVMRTLGFKETEDRDLISQIKFGLSNKQMMIVLDNCEHLIDHIALFTSELLTSCPNIKILATSREALRIPGEWIYAVPALGTPEINTPIRLEEISKYPALTLFVERARASRSDFLPDDENIQAIASICAQLDGLPLSIELIASRIRLMTPNDLLKRLSDEYILSVDGMRAVSARQKTINNAINWSYEFLTTDEKNMFDQLAVFSGGFTLEAVTAIYSPASNSDHVSNLVTSLLDKNLLQRRLDDGQKLPYYMLMTIKQFALQKLRHKNNEIETRTRHLAYYLELAEAGSEKMRGPGLVEWGNRLEEEHDNLRAALEWSITNQITVTAVRLLRALGWPWEIHGHYSEARCWLDRIVNLPDLDQHGEAYAGLLNHIGRHSWSQGNIHDARSLLEESMELSEMLGNSGERTRAEALNWLGLVSLYGDRDWKKAKLQVDDGLRRFNCLHDLWGIALSTFHLGIIEMFKENYELAIKLLKESLSEFHELGDQFFIARVCSYLAETFRSQGDLFQAKIYFQQCLEIDLEIKFWNGIIDDWCDLGKIYQQQDDYNLASRCYEEAVVVCKAQNLIKDQAFYNAGLLALKNEEYELAFEHFKKLLIWKINAASVSSLGSLLGGLAGASAGLKRWETSAILSGITQVRLGMEGNKMEPLASMEYNRLIQETLNHYGSDEFDLLKTKGRKMSLNQVQNLFEI